jgi:hypothetical protein
MHNFLLIETPEHAFLMCSSWSEVHDAFFLATTLRDYAAFVQDVDAFHYYERVRDWCEDAFNRGFASHSRS